MAKTLSVKCPYAYLICLGIKDVENRSWNTEYRGRLLIHSSGKIQDIGVGLSDLDYQNYNQFISTQDELSDAEFISKLDSDNRLDKMINCPEQKVQHIIGEVELIDIINDSQSEYSEKGQYHWILSNPVLYDKPIMAKGKLKLWEF